MPLLTVSASCGSGCVVRGRRQTPGDFRGLQRGGTLERRLGVRPGGEGMGESGRRGRTGAARTNLLPR